MGTGADERTETKYLKDRERLLETYDAILNRVKEVETEKAVLDEKLKSSEARQQELQQKLTAAVSLIRSPTGSQAEIDSESLSELRELRSSISRLLTTQETPEDRPVVGVKELRSSIDRLLTSGDMPR